MRRHFKQKHPYTFHIETEKSKKAWECKRKSEIPETESEMEQNEANSNADFEMKFPKNIVAPVPKKRRSAVWKHFTEISKGFVRCKICSMKLRDKHYVVVLHLNRRHPNAFDNLGNFNVMPFQQRNNFLWNFFADAGKKLVRCLLCGITIRKNMARHLQTKHPGDFELAIRSERQEIAKYCEPRTVKGPRTWVKKYCIKIADKQYKCNQCKAVLKMPNGLFGNMRRHIKVKHPNIYYKESKVAKSDKRNIGSTEITTDLLYIDNSNRLSLKDPLADFGLDSPVMSETEIAANFLENDNLANNLCSEIDLNTIADLPVLEPSRQSDHYDKSYFLLVDDGQYKCIECEETVNCHDNDEQGALFIHIRDKHPEEIMTLQATSTENDDEFQVVVLGNIALDMIYNHTEATYSPVLITTEVILDQQLSSFRFNISRRDLVDGTLSKNEPITEDASETRYAMLIPQLYPDQPAAVWFKCRFNILYQQDLASSAPRSTFPFPPPLPPPPPPPGSPPFMVCPLPPSPSELFMLPSMIPMPATPPMPTTPPMSPSPPPLPISSPPVYRALMPLPIMGHFKPKVDLFNRYIKEIKEENFSDSD